MTIIMAKATVLSFTGGRHCKECGDQIAPARLRVLPDTQRCGDCQAEREANIKRARMGSRPNDIEIIRG